MSDSLLILLVIVLAVVGSYLFGGVRGWMRNRLLGVVFLVVLGLIAARCGLI